MSKLLTLFQNVPKKLPKVRSLCGNISTWGQSQTYPNFTALRTLTLWHSMSATTPSKCLPQSRLFQSWHNSECPGDLVPRGGVQGGPEHKFLLILLSAASLTCSKQVARHSHSRKDIEAFNMIANSRSVAKFLGDNMMCQWCAIPG